jgi:GNAT superfamily N-acetyltransferase
MPEVQIRPAVATDITALVKIDHSSKTEYVWQMDVQREEGQLGTLFREIRLPRPVAIPYPRVVSTLPDSWNRQAGMLVAIMNEQVAGYIRMSDLMLPRTAWLTDVVVAPRFRRQGIGMALILAAQSWAVERKDNRMLLEMTTKNNPAICLARKLGFEFCGYNDLYFETQDIALFFGRSIR